MYESLSSRTVRSFSLDGDRCCHAWRFAFFVREKYLTPFSGLLIQVSPLQENRSLIQKVHVCRLEPARDEKAAATDGAGPVRGSRVAPSAAEKRIAKTYRALVWGVIPEDSIEVDQPIGRIKHGGVRGGLHAAASNGKPSRSRIRVIWRDVERNVTLVAVDLFTGRPHQIRIHCAAAGYPLVGDPLYVEGGVPAETSHRKRSAGQKGARGGGNRESFDGARDGPAAREFRLGTDRERTTEAVEDYELEQRGDLSAAREVTHSDEVGRDVDMEDDG